MQIKVVKLDPTTPEPAKIKEAADLVDGGGLVAFPTETVYGIACRVKNDSLKRLDNLKARDPDKYYTLHICEKQEVEKYVPSIGLRAGKLTKSAWPGPLTIVFQLDAEAMKIACSNLAKEVFENLYKDNSIGIRCPDNAAASLLLRETRNAVVAPSANIAGQPPAIDADQVVAAFTDQIELVLDAGPCKYKKNSTVVKVGKNGPQILRPGVYTQEDVEKMSEIRFLFVCTGNTCRSPMAEGIFRKYWAEKLGCNVDQLKEKGYKSISAGTIGATGWPATHEAVAACAAREVDIRNHKSQALSKELIEESDFVFTMSLAQRNRVLALNPDANNKCALLAGDAEVADPIGQKQEVYNNCAQTIEKAVREIICGIAI